MKRSRMKANIRKHPYPESTVTHEELKTRMGSLPIREAEPASDKTPHTSRNRIKHDKCTFLDMMKDRIEKNKKEHVKCAYSPRGTAKTDVDPIEWTDDPESDDSSNCRLKPQPKRSNARSSSNKNNLISIMKKSRHMVNKAVNTDMPERIHHMRMVGDNQEGPDEDELSMRALVGSMTPRTSP